MNHPSHDRLDPARRALLERRLARSAGGADAPIPRRTGSAPPPLSFAQQRMWLLDQLAPGNSAYNVPRALRLRGPLNVPALQHALAGAVARHEVLRTRYACVDGLPVQLIDAAADVALPVRDLSSRPADRREAEAQALLVEEVRRPFDLARDAGLRALLARLGPDDHFLLVTCHHIAADNWSKGVLFRELAGLYNAFVAGRPAPLPELPIQYADFAVWQREYLQGEALRRQLAYWKEHLAGAPAALDLPADHPRPPVQTYRGARHFPRLPAELLGQVKELSRREHTTPFMTLLAGFKALLARYTGQEDVVVSVPIAGRTRAETEGLIGLFTNTLVLRTDLSGDPPFREVLRRVRQAALGAFDHQDLPFEKLVEELQPERDRSRTPLFQVLFSLENAAVRAPDLSGLTAELVDLDFGIAKTDLVVSWFEQTAGMRGLVEYSTDLFEAETIRRLLEHYQVLLAGASTDPDRCLSALPLLTAAERSRVLAAGSAPSPEGTSPAAECVHHMIEAQAARTPEAVAVLGGGRQLTYRELNERANRLAHRLRKHGVGPDVLVALCLERSSELVVGILGTLKAGGAYVPLDPAYPKDRLAFLLADSRPAVLLTRQGMAAVLPEHGARVCYLDDDGADLAAESAENPLGGPTADNLAYVIYTSGSLGRPKGVAMPHRPLTNLLSWQLRGWAAPAARTLQLAPSSFDVSFQEIAATLSAGGTLVLITEDVRRDPVALLRCLADNGIERLFLPPVALEALAEAAESTGVAPARLREVIAAGEALRLTPTVRRFFGRLPGCRLHNQYGPTESHVVTAFPMTGAPDQWPALPPIGRPIDNARIHILDVHLQPVPPGVAGELYIGGVPLARCYLNRPELTAERFVPDPFGGAGQRLYRTGDRARVRGDGQIEFLGRVDQQLKIRGYRVEPGEVEAALAEHPHVREAAVAAWEAVPGDRRLVAYVAPQRGSAPTAQDLRTYLKARLPEFMVPAAFVFLDALPLTPSGKVNRRALPPPRAADLAEGRAFVEPRGATEQAVAGIWAEVLGRERIGAHDNFFDLGGHSLLVMRVALRVLSALGIAVPLRILFEAPTVAEFAAAIEREARKRNEEAENQLLAEVEGLTDEEALRLLQSETEAADGGAGAPRCGGQP
jgi:amino acid adenylation domain-containing protein